jgi:hypothetical protein
VNLEDRKSWNDRQPVTWWLSPAAAALQAAPNGILGEVSNPVALSAALELTLSMPDCTGFTKTSLCQKSGSLSSEMNTINLAALFYVNILVTQGIDK